MKKLIFAALVLLITVAAQAQKTKITGVIKENNTGVPIYGINVYVQGTTIGTTTNKQGYFSLKGIPSGSFKLVVTGLGYRKSVTELLATPGDMVFNLNLKEAEQQLHEVVITGTGTPHHLKNAPVQTELISKKAIKEVSAKDFSNLMMGVNPSFDFSPGSMGNFMTLNGLGNKYILILVDGKRLYGDLGDQTDLSRINTENIERIEVVKGASSSLYGSEAIAGVINIITKKSKNKVLVSNNTLASNYATLQQNNSVHLNFGKVSSHTSFTYKQTDGWQLSPYEYDSKKDTLIETDAKAQNAYKNYTVTQNISYAVNSKLELYAEGSFYENDITKPESVSKYGYFFSDVSFSGGAKYLINSNSVLDFTAASDNFKYYYKYNQESGDYNVGDKQMNKDQKRNEYQLKYVSKLGENHQLTLGANYVFENLYSEARVVGDEANAFTVSAFIQDEMKLFKGFTLVAGGRYVDHKTFGAAFTPKLTALYKLSDFNFRANYANGFKAPTLKELYYRYEKRGSLYLGNPELKPQRSNYFAASVEYNPKKVALSLTAYKNMLSNMIGYETIETTPEDEANGIKKTRKHKNIAKAETQGFDFIANFQLPYGFTIGGGYSYVDAQNVTDSVRLEGVAQNYTNLRLNYAKHFSKYGLNVSLLGRIQDDKWYDDGIGKGYSDWKLSTAHKLTSLKNCNLELTLGIDNIFDYVDDTPYGMHYGTITPGRTFFAGLRIDFMQ